VGFWPANRDGDDIVLWKTEKRAQELARLYTLRQQMEKGSDKPNYALSDFIAPPGAPDYVGAFAVTAGIGEEDVAIRFKRANDDYSAILAQALCDRLAEAFAEAMHAKVRRELWGYAADEALSNDELIAEKYRGIRPAPGYPAQPDHTEKRTIFDLLEVRDRTGIDLTESMAMTPPSSVSGLYFAHPEAEYFGVGKIDRDQVADYAQRKGWDVAIAERWLSPILAYDPLIAKAS
jgi:5-methyltetrahydrofolate--homocysteine methyltransferase